MAVARTRNVANRRPADRFQSRRRPSVSRPNRSPVRAPLQFRWADTISSREWAIYRAAIEAVRGTGVRFMLGGGFALASYTGRWRDTKDIDLYVHPQDREPVIRALADAGFEDYYSRLVYDRHWIYRSVRNNVIVDIIWSMANRRAQVDDVWFERAGSVTVREEQLQVIPAEEFMWCKLYILQRDHCDWTDLFNLLYATGPQLDWTHLIERLEDDTPLLKALLTVYGWLCPKYVLKLPAALWRQLGMPPPAPATKRPAYNRIRLLDYRQWFAARQAPGQKLQV